MDGRFPLGLLFAAITFSFLAVGIFWPKTPDQSHGKRPSKFKISCGVSVAMFSLFLFAGVFDPRLVTAFMPPLLVALAVLLSAGKAIDWVTRKS